MDDISNIRARSPLHWLKWPSTYLTASLLNGFQKRLKRCICDNRQDFTVYFHLIFISQGFSLWLNISWKSMDGLALTLNWLVRRLLIDVLISFLRCFPGLYWPPYRLGQMNNYKHKHMFNNEWAVPPWCHCGDVYFTYSCPDYFH